MRYLCVGLRKVVKAGRGIGCGCCGRNVALSCGGVGRRISCDVDACGGKERAMSGRGWEEHLK